MALCPESGKPYISDMNVYRAEYKLFLGDVKVCK